MAKVISSSGLLFFAIAAVLYLAGNSLWLGFGMLGFLVELIGMALIVYEKNNQIGAASNLPLNQVRQIVLRAGRANERLCLRS